ncbi:putative nucleotidyltransferase [Nocardiopsis mwathae]|uniref:Putative nucleotidyltransferase n=1 Tax=Nocardiopsis mwathae TaxID=1472723 RepID=A0A7X0D5Z1_9ACTN|nr:nucleotidyltransferase domain-containing protein [Nocardiopsis mwathae]MBB6171589.1 putative nucleotidyltransferase [Nocardiopsis mwathae]
MRLSDDRLTHEITTALADLPGVHAVTLGGSRATGTHTPDSDFDFAIYYRGEFDPDHLRALGWDGQVFDIGEWGGGVFNGGAWITYDGRHIDVHYRDLDDVEHRIAEAEKGRFDVEQLAFHLAGIPTYLVVAELAINKVLYGELPRTSYPEALRRSAPARWWGQAELTLAYARKAHAERGHATETAGAVATAAAQAAHAVAAARGIWVTNEKRLLDLAGLRGIDEIRPGPDPATLTDAVDAAVRLLGEAVEQAQKRPGE